MEENCLCVLSLCNSVMWLGQGRLGVCWWLGQVVLAKGILYLVGTRIKRKFVTSLRQVQSGIMHENIRYEDFLVSHLTEGILLANPEISLYCPN